MWKITMIERSEQIYAGGYTNDHVAKFDMVCFTDKPEIADYFRSRSRFKVEELDVQNILTHAH